MEGPGFRRRGTGIRRLSASVLLAAAILGSAGLATACGQSGSGSGAIASLSPGSKAASLIPSKSAGSAAADASTGVTSPASAFPQSSAPQSSAPQASAPQAAPPQASAPQASAPQPSLAATPATGGSGSSLLWLWILIGVIVVGGGIALIAYSSRKRARQRAADAAGWRTRVINVYAEGQALHDAIWTSAGLGQPPGGGADPRSSSIQLRADKLTQDLYTLRESAPDEVRHARIVDVLVELQGVRSAMEASVDLAGRLAAFQAALHGLRASADPSSSSAGSL